jgi:hypothetical protein
MEYHQSETALVKGSADNGRLGSSPFLSTNPYRGETDLHPYQGVVVPEVSIPLSTPIVAVAPFTETAVRLLFDAFGINLGSRVIQQIAGKNTTGRDDAGPLSGFPLSSCGAPPGATSAGTLTPTLVRFKLD